MSAVSLDLLDRATVRARARNIAVAAVFVALAAGGLVGLFAGVAGFAGVVCVVGLPLLLLAWSESRKTYSLDGTELSVREFGTRAVDLGQAESLDVLVTNVRGMRTISLLAKGPPKGKAVNLALAMYREIGAGQVGAGQVGGKELDVYPLRRLADALASTGDTRALVLSELLVAQLKAEARGDAGGDRPLYRIGQLAGGGRMAQRLPSEAVAKFVTALD